MTNINMGLEKTEGEILAFEVSDDTLEIAAGIAKGGWATFPGMEAPNNNVAEACAKMLNALK